MIQFTSSTIAVATALTSAGGAFIGVIFSTWMTKKNLQKQANLAVTIKIADFRQAWINSLRDELSSYAAKAWGEVDEELYSEELLQMGLKIQLLMNRTDNRYSALEAFCDNPRSCVNFTDIATPNKQFVMLCQDILKCEWEVLKADMDKSSRL